MKWYLRIEYSKGYHKFKNKKYRCVYPLCHMILQGACVATFCALISFLYSNISCAGGPLNTAFGRSVVYQELSLPLAYRVDQGNLGTLSNAQATALVDSCFAVWQAVPTARISFVNEGYLSEDVAGSNVFSYFNDADGLNPILFDSDGSMVDAVFGIGAKDSVIGFAGSDVDQATGYYTEGIAVINGRFSEVFSHEQFKATFVHEFGHFIGLDHCQINTPYAGDGDTANDIYLPTMFPTATDDDTSLSTLNPDDEAALTLLYPQSPAIVDAAYGKIKGSVKWHTGLPVLGANIVAVKVGDEMMSRFSSVSDYFQQDTGAFEMLVTPGTYRLYIEPINRSFTGGSSVGPYAQTLLSPSFIKPVKTTFYNTDLTVGPGDTVQNIIITARPSRASTLCPAELLLGTTAQATGVLRQFRDSVLAATPLGRRYILLYQTYSPEINSLLMRNAAVRRLCRSVLRVFARELQTIMGNPEAGISPKLQQEIHVLCQTIGAASPTLRTVLNIINHNGDLSTMLSQLIKAAPLHANTSTVE